MNLMGSSSGGGIEQPQITLKLGGDHRTPNMIQSMNFLPTTITPLPEAAEIEEEVGGTTQSTVFRVPRLECVHHGLREFKHEGGIVKQELKSSDPKALLMYHCEDCREFCCEYCISLGPHNNELHRVHLIIDFQERYQHLIASFLGSSAKAKSMQLFAKIKQINTRIELINNQTCVIERDAFIEFTHILERLELAEGKKISVLHNDIGRLQREINTIEDAVKSFENLASRDDRRIFLLFYRKLNVNITQAQSIRFKSEITETPYDLPRDIQSMKVQMQNFRPNDEILKFKDILIWGLIEEHRQQLLTIAEEQKKVYSEKLEQWTKLARKTFEEFEGLQMICHYCGELINDDIINTDCFANLFKRDRDMSELMFQLIKKKKMEKGIDLSAIFTAHDIEKNNYVSVIQFSYVLNALLEVEESFVTRATDFLAITKAEYTKLNEHAVVSTQNEDLNKTLTSAGGGSRSLAQYYAAPPTEDQNAEAIAEAEAAQVPSLVNYVTFLAILDHPEQLEYESFRTVNVEYLRQATNSYFVSFNEDLAKKYIADHPRRDMNKGKFGTKIITDLNSTIRRRL